MRRSLRALAALVALCGATTARADGEDAGLQPYQLVRSLQLLQDRIADGDQAALPLQKKMLELVDQRLKAADDKTLRQERNVRAALTYGMSGGNPATLANVLRNPVVSVEDKTIGQGILAYIRGNSDIARKALEKTDPTSYPAEIGAFLALVKGSVTSRTDAKAALRQLDLARLLGPGTLVEEAALRRSLALHAFLKDPDRFLMAAEQYARRFLRSPYAGQFADSLVTGVLDLHDHIDLARLEGITKLMDADQRKVIYLRLARRATVDGLTEFAAFAAKMAGEDSTTPDARAALYSKLSGLTSDNVEETASSLRTIDRQQLSESDVKLLDAAQAVMTQMTAPPEAGVGDGNDTAAPEATTEEPKTAQEQALAGVDPTKPDSQAAPNDASGHDSAPGGQASVQADAHSEQKPPTGDGTAQAAAETKPAADAKPAAAASGNTETHDAATAAVTGDAAHDGAPAATDAASGKVSDVSDMVKSTRAKLSAIDDLLEASK